MLTIEAVRGEDRRGGRAEVFVKGSSLPLQLRGQPIFFELIGGELSDFATLDFALLALIHFIMERKEPAHIAGPVSERLLRNMRGYQRLWQQLRPDRYWPVALTADEVVPDMNSRLEKPRAIACYSGGVDSAFTVLTHRQGLAGIGTKHLTAVLIVQGFDVDMDDNTSFLRLVDRLRPVFAEFRVRSYAVRTNLKQLNLQDWRDSHLAQLAGCLNLLAHRYSSALIATDGFDERDVLPWGGNALTVPLLSTGRLKIFYDGIYFTRADKIAVIAQFPTIRKSLKFCWEGSDPAKNCGRCGKCIRTYLSFLAVGIPDPGCFEVEMNGSLVEILDVKSRFRASNVRDLLVKLNKVPALRPIQENLQAKLIEYEETLASQTSGNSAPDAAAAAGAVAVPI